MRTFRDAKTMAKTLRAELLERKQVELGHSECLEIVSRQFGHDNWNVMAAKIEQLAGIHGDGSTSPQSAANTTIPVLRIFDVDQARRFYVDFLGCTLDFGGPADGESSNFYGQVSRAGSTFHLTETQYVASPGATIGIWMTGLDDLHRELNEKRQLVEVWGPAVWVPYPEQMPWARVMTITDPFGNTLRFSEPTDPKDQRLPRW
jgi:hypothetical protein